MLKGEELIKYCVKKIRTISDKMTVVNANRQQALKFYRGDKDIVPKKSGVSEVITHDVMDTIEWIKPSLLDIFTSGNEIVSFVPVGAEDVTASENLNVLVNYQVRVKNKWFLVMHDWIMDALIMKTGIVKYQWVKDTKTIEKKYEGLTQEEYEAKIAEPNVEIVEVAEHRTINMTTLASEGIPVDGTMAEDVKYDVTVKYTIEDEYPYIEVVPPENFGFDISAKSVDNMDFCYEIYKISGDEFKRKYGEEKYHLLRNEDVSSTSVEKERLVDIGGMRFYDSDTDTYYCYEVYYKDPDDGEKYIVKLCGNEILENPVKNIYGKPPYEIINALKVSHRVLGYSVYDLLKEIMQIRTVLMRQILDNLYFSNNRRYFGDPNRVNIDDFLNNNKPMAFIRTTGNPAQAVMPEEKAPLPMEIFTFWEMLNLEKDYHSGLPRSFQGITKTQIAKTWRGQTQQIAQASQRIQLMARLMAEMGVAPLMNDIADLNIRFLKKKTAVRILNDFIEISPDNIIGKYDIIVTVGLGTGDKTEQIGYLQQMLGLYSQIFQSGLGIISSENVYNVFKELLKNMGYKNVEDYITKPRTTQMFLDLLKIVLPSLPPNVLMNPQLHNIIETIGKDMGIYTNIENTVQGLLQSFSGTFPNQKTPELPKQPIQPFNMGEYTGAERLSEGSE